MNTMKTLRKDRLGLKQGEMARITGASQTKVCRWEMDITVPDLNELTRLREWALSSGIEWNDAWLFEPPPEVAQPAAEAA